MPEVYRTLSRAGKLPLFHPPNEPLGGSFWAVLSNKSLIGKSYKYHLCPNVLVQPSAALAVEQLGKSQCSVPMYVPMDPTSSWLSKGWAPGVWVLLGFLPPRTSFGLKSHRSPSGWYVKPHLLLCRLKIGFLCCVPSREVEGGGWGLLVGVVVHFVPLGAV